MDCLRFIHFQLGTLALFATGIIVLAPRAEAVRREIDCEMFVLYPVSALISPLVHELPGRKPEKVTEEQRRLSFLQRLQDKLHPKHYISLPKHKEPKQVIPPRPPHWGQRR